MSNVETIQWRHPDKLREIADQLEGDNLIGAAKLYRRSADEMEARRPFLHDLLFTAWKGAKVVEVPAAIHDNDAYGRGAEIAAFLMRQGWTPPRELASPAVARKAGDDQ
ncbi:hypothetical protein SEA_VERITY_77 [Gordonia phage Verity]|uniref:Uncharacterized protein n=1 Tax=Gordonia phage Verity TaxID=2591211 RepID=A0A514DIX1_9CAUD|nr:hypothetical protein J1776_gp77 [Gordonia phage Verity]QDH93563.1 hypothetical protein SEA_VERITY_77 [Gordonia phage Verity]QPO16921.1 hypothetical protein SEA_DELREY21_78 [Gordonia phage Delrey21]QXN74204.1 hypothetical protein SEA_DOCTORFROGGO_78 [Gordonia phage DoctorFroggo]